MQTSHFINRPDVELPKCRECDVSMWLARVAPDKPDHDKCTFECSACNAMIIQIVKHKQAEKPKMFDTALLLVTGEADNGS
jgi:hypothetical protein